MTGPIKSRAKTSTINAASTTKGVETGLDQFMKGLEQPQLFRRLEPRIMFDGAALATADAIDDGGSLAPLADAPQEPAQSGTAPDIVADLYSAADVSGAPAFSSSIVFIDGGVADAGALAAAADGAEVVILDPASDGLAQIASHLEGRQGISAIHILSHGESG